MGPPQQGGGGAALLAAPPLGLAPPVMATMRLNADHSYRCGLAVTVNYEVS
jgi:hypothetical protein